ncbi:MAG: hypothetical protein WD207_09065 [Xanthobacteraceae bacterium]
MADAARQRAQTDTETVRALLLANGGGAVAMLATLPPVLDRDGYEPLARAMLFGLLILMIGVVFAIVYNYLRRKCSLEYERHDMNPPKGRIFGVQLWEPTVCCVSIVCLWLSVVAFLGAGSFVAATGITTLAEVQSQKATGRPGGAADPRAAKGKSK